MRNTLGLGHSAWAAYLHLTEREYLRVFEGRRQLPVTALMHASSRLDLNIEAFYLDEIDYPSLAAHFSGDSSYISEKYTVGAFSRRRTVANILEGVELIAGTEIRSEAARKFQLTPAALSDHDAPVNILLVSDLIQFLKGRGLTDPHFFSIGAHSLVTNRASALAGALKEIRRPRDAYERVFVHLIGFHERNCNYQMVELHHDSCVVESATSQETSDSLGFRHVGNHDVCTYRSGVMASTLGYIGLPYADVIESQCVHQGAPRCRFEIDYGRARWFEKQAERRRARGLGGAPLG